MSDRDWQSFERKIQGGKLIEQAAEETGIPVQEAIEWLAARRGQKKDEEALRILAAEALHHGITTLIELTKIRDGRVGTETDEDDESGFRKTTKFDHPDGAAARALVQTGLQLRKLIKAPTPTQEGQDLFDKAPPSNWSFPLKR